MRGCELIATPVSLLAFMSQVRESYDETVANLFIPFCYFVMIMHQSFGKVEKIRVM